MNTKAAALLAIGLFVISSSVVADADAARTVRAQGPGRDAAFILNLGFEDFAGFRIAVDPSGRAWAIDGAGRISSRLDSNIVNRLFSDLRAAGTLSLLAAQHCVQAEPGIQFSTNVRAPLIVAWRGQATADLSCATDQRALALRADAAAVQRALAVQSYRVRSTRLGDGNTINAHSVVTDLRYAQPAAAQYTFDSSHFDVGRFDAEDFKANAFSSHAFSNERFQTDAFTMGSFPATRLTIEPFSNATFADADFHFNPSSFHSDTFNSGFASGYGNGGFGSGNFGGGSFGGGSFLTYPSP